jgi:adenosine deaminase
LYKENAMTIQPLAVIAIDPWLAALPKADLHIHQEGKARLDRVIAQRSGRAAYDWLPWAKRLLAESVLGMDRLNLLHEPDAALTLEEQSDNGSALFVDRVCDLLTESAADGSMLVEVRFGTTDTPALDDFMPLFREAERKVQVQYPRLRAEAIVFLNMVDDPVRLADVERRFELCLQAARDGLSGIDFRVDPYHTPANPALWELAYRWAERAANAGLGITVHAGEFSDANLAAALRMPGLRRLGHAVHAASSPQLLEQLATSGVTVESSLTCNVILGAVPSYEQHPIRQFMEYGIPVTINTDNPVHTCTTIGREYAIAASLGLSSAQLLECTRTAIRSSFAAPERRRAILEELDEWTLPQL